MKWVPRPSRTLRRAGTDAAGVTALTPPVNQTKSSPNLRSLSQAPLRPTDKNDNRSSATARAIHQSALHRVAMDVPQLLHSLLRRPNVEIVKTSLPEARAHSRVLTRSDSAGGSLPVSQAKGRSCPRLTEEAIAGSTNR